MSSKLVKIYTKEHSINFIQEIKTIAKAFVSGHFLAYQFAKRDINAQYRQSILGLFWVILLPLITALIWIILQQTNTVNIQTTQTPYFLHVITGIFVWSIFSDSIISPNSTVQGMRNSLSKINFPKEALILSGVYKTLFNASAKIILLIAFVLVYDYSILSYQLLLMPIFLILIILFGTALGVIITPLSLLFNDVQRLINPSLQLLMYLSPVVFPFPKNDEGLFNFIVFWNPISPLISNFRNSLIGIPLNQLFYCSFIFMITIICLVISLVIFRITMPIITERISS